MPYIPPRFRKHPLHKVKVNPQIVTPEVAPARELKPPPLRLDPIDFSEMYAEETALPARQPVVRQRKAEKPLPPSPQLASPALSVRDYNPDLDQLAKLLGGN